MRNSSRAWWLAVPLMAAAVGVGSAQNPQEPTAEFADEYRTGDYGRVRLAESGVTIVRGEWDHERGVIDRTGLNAPIFPGDAVSTAAGQRVEVQLAGGTLVWIDDRTELEFLALPDPYADFPDHAVLKLGEGQARLATALDDDEEFRVDTPAASVYPLGDSEVRIEVGAGGWTRVLSRRGVVEVVGQGGSVLLRGGTQTEVEPGALPIDPRPFNTFSDDGFDRWVEERADTYSYGETLAQAPGAYRELPDEVRPYYRELSAHGTWSHVDDYGYVWQPVGIGSDWKPYYDGYWGYGPEGYFWISHEPWGWAPYHYGRWSWITGYGWCWSPGSVFGGAWVSWSWGSVYVGWSPLNYWNYPAYHSAWHYGYYDPYCWTFVGYRHFGHHQYSRYSVGWDHVRHDVDRSAVVTRPPRYSPGRLASSVDTRRRAYEEARSESRHRLAPSAGNEARQRSFRANEFRTAPPVAQARSRTDTSVPPPAGRDRNLTPTRPPVERNGGTYRRPEREERARVPVVTQPRYPRRITNEKPPAAQPSRTPPARTGYERPPVDARKENPRKERLQDLYRKMAQPRQIREQPTTRKPAARPAPQQARPQPTRKPPPKATPQPVRKPAPRATPQRTPSARPKPAKRPPSRATPSRTPTARPKPKPKPKPTSASSPARRPAPPKKRSR